MWKMIYTAALLSLFTVGGCGNGQESPASPWAEARFDVQESNAPQILENAQSSEQTNEKGEEEMMRISVKSEDYEIIYELNDSRAAAQLYAQLPLHTEVAPFSNNEMTFFPQALDTEDTPLSSGEVGSLSYYAPWGDVVMFYGPCTPNSSLYELGRAVSGEEHIAHLSGTITVSAIE